MTKNEHAIVQGIVISRKNLIELIVVAVLLAFGVDLIAGHIPNLLMLSPLATVVVGAVLCLGCVFYLAFRLFGKRVERRTYEAFLIYNQKENKIIEVPRYSFSENVCHYMEYASVENPALKTLWENEPLEDKTDSARVEIKHKKSAQLLSEMAEYIVLSMLSVHLTDYFASEEFKKKNLKEYGREDIPDVLLKNRYLELFSRPMEDRPIFTDASKKDNRPGEILGVYAYGAIYEKFHLVLPKESTIRRLNANNIEIETEKLTMSITVRFEGFNINLPTGFEQYYLALSDWQNITAYQLSVDIQVKMKLWAMLSKIGWEYYRWVDSFLDEIKGEISQEAFFNRINWEATLTMLQCLNRSQAKVTRIKK